MNFIYTLFISNEIIYVKHDGDSRDSSSPNVTGDAELEDEDERSSSVAPSSPRMESETDRPLSNNMSHQSGSNEGTPSPGSRYAKK